VLELGGKDPFVVSALTQEINAALMHRALSNLDPA